MVVLRKIPNLTAVFQPFGLLILLAASTLSTASAATYPSMAPIAQYDMPDQAGEIALG